MYVFFKQIYNEKIGDLLNPMQKNLEVDLPCHMAHFSHEVLVFCHLVFKFNKCSLGPKFHRWKRILMMHCTLRTWQRNTSLAMRMWHKFLSRYGSIWVANATLWCSQFHFIIYHQLSWLFYIFCRAFQGEKLKQQAQILRALYLISFSTLLLSLGVR